jgi:cytochrome c
MDMKFGPDGDLYLLDYGSRWFTKSDDARLVRIAYNAGNRAPVATASANRLGGVVPFDVTALVGRHGGPRRRHAALRVANDTRLSALPLQGSFTPDIPQGDNGRGSLVLRAVYADRGAGDLPPIITEAMTVLRSPRLGPQHADVEENVVAAPVRGAAGAVLPRAGSHIGYRGVDLTGVTRVEVAAQAQGRGGHAGGRIEIRTGSPNGPIIGQLDVLLAGGRGGPTASDIQAAGGRGQGGGRGGAGGLGIDLKPTTGVHDLYFVFTNDRAASAQPLMTLASITLAVE